MVDTEIKKGRIFGYARVSTREQNLDRQIKALLDAGVPEEHIVKEKASGKTMDREGYQAFKSPLGLRTGDTLIIKSLDRLSRNKEHIKAELFHFNERKIRLKIIDIPTTMIDTGDINKDGSLDNWWIFEMINNILMEVLSTIAEQERLTTKQRQKEGIAVMPVVNGKRVSNKTGTPTGRPKAAYPPLWDEVYAQWTEKQITAKEAMNKLGLTRCTFYNLVKRLSSSQD